MEANTGSSTHYRFKFTANCAYSSTC